MGRRILKKIGKETDERIMDLDAGETIAQTDVLRRYHRPGIGYKRYVIEPNCKYHELECVAVSRGDILSIRTEFFWKDEKDSIAEYGVFYVD